MFKVHILSKCAHCNGEAYLPCGEAKIAKVVSTLVTFLAQSVKVVVINLSGSTWKTSPNCCIKQICPHEHTSYQGSMRFTAGDVWDDIQEVCDDCGAHLDKH